MMDNEVLGLVDRFIPAIHKQSLNGNGNIKAYASEGDSRNELRLMKIHRENALVSGLNIIGVDDLIASLNECQEDSIFIINMRNDRFFFKLCLSNNSEHFLGCIVIELKKKTEEELRWHRDVLGIKTLPPDI